MTKLHLRFIHEFRDRHGKLRRYFRRPGVQRIALEGEPGSEQFMAAYQHALAIPAVPIGASRSAPGSVAAAVASYLESPIFASLSQSTQKTYRGILENFREEHGEKRFGKLERRHIENMVSNRARTPVAANNLLRMLRTLMQYALTAGLRRDDPTAGVRKRPVKSDGFRTWTEDEIARFEAHHDRGTRARLAFDLLLYTAQRRGDVVRLGRQHLREGIISIRQHKTGTLVEIPLHPELAASIVAHPSEHLTFLVTEFGKPFTAAGFGNLFRDWCQDAGLDRGLAAHGLRKAASRRLAEAGCTAHEIMAITGHKTLKEVTRYTAAVDRKRLGRSAMAKITKGTPSGKPS